jgi:uroporphyrinogen-III synthase
MPVRPIICLVRSKALDADAAELFALANTDVMQISMIDQVIQDAASIDAALAAASNAHWLIFVSPFAVHATQQLLPSLFERTHVKSRDWAAVGQSTARALHGALSALPINQIWQPSADREGSAALLAVLPLPRFVDQTVAVFAAPDGLSILQDGLSAAGAQVIDVPVYQRRARQSPQVAQSAVGQTISPQVPQSAVGQTISPQVAQSAVGQTISPQVAQSAVGQTISPQVAQSAVGQTSPSMTVELLARLAAIQFASVLQLELWLTRYATVIAAAIAANPNWRSEIIVIVPSARVAAAAERAGFAKIRVQSVSDDTALARFLLT